MARSNVNVGFAKCFISFMAIVILLQGCGYLGLAIWGVTQESCSKKPTNLEENPFNFIVHFIYFQSIECGPMDINVAGLPVDSTPIFMDWDTSFVITNRMNIFLITYAVVSAVWIVTSLLVLVSICGAITKTVAAIAFWPWFLIVIGGSALDVVVAGYSIHDIVHTTSAADTFEYIGADGTNQSLMNLLKPFDAYFVTPALVMTLISTRVVVIWLLNLFGTGFCLSLSRVLAKNNDATSRNDQDFVTNRTIISSAPPNQSAAIATVQQDESNRNLQQPQREIQTPTQTQNIEQYPPQIAPKPLLLKKPATSPQPQELAGYNNQPLTNERQIESPIIQPYPSAPSPDESVVQYSRVIAVNSPPHTPMDDTTYRNTESHPDRLNYPATQPAALPLRESSNLKPEQMEQLSTVTPLNNRYTHTEGLVQPSGQPQRVSAELRSQLPWSYTSLLAKPQPPRKPQMKVYPEIPEPDYTLNSSQDERVTSVGNNGNVAGQRESQQGYSRW